MEPMSKAEIQAFLSDSARTGKLATVRADGRPHLVPVWFVVDGDDLVFMTFATSVKMKNIQRDPHVVICVDDEVPPYSFVSFEGVATLSEDLADLRHWAARIGGKYMGEDQAEAFGERNGVPGEVVVRVSPTNAFSRKGMTD